MRDASICGLGQTATSAAESAIRAGLVSSRGRRSRRGARRGPGGRCLPCPTTTTRPCTAPTAGTRRDTDISRIPLEPPARPSQAPVAPPAPDVPVVELTLDGRPVAVPAGSTILEACRSAGIDIPTLCFLETLTPVNVCRVCVVEVTGARVLVPACSRQV